MTSKLALSVPAVPWHSCAPASTPMSFVWSAAGAPMPCYATCMYRQLQSCPLLPVRCSKVATSPLTPLILTRKVRHNLAHLNSFPHSPRHAIISRPAKQPTPFFPWTEFCLGFDSPSILSHRATTYRSKVNPAPGHWTYTPTHYGMRRFPGYHLVNPGYTTKTAADITLSRERLPQ